MKRRSVSSALAERRKQRAAVTPSKRNVRHVKFSPEEMAIDASDVDASVPSVVLHGLKEWREFLSVKRGYVRLDHDLRAVFTDDRMINDLLRQFVDVANKTIATKRKKSA